MAEGGDVHGVRIFGMDADFADMPAVFESDVLPGPSTVGGFVDAVTVGHVVANATLAGTHVQHVGVGLRYCNRADRRGAEIPVRNILPIAAAVGRLPHATRASAEIERHRLS